MGGWFLLQQGLVQESATAPSWLLGPANPIGGVMGWLGLGLGLLVLVRRRWW